MVRIAVPLFGLGGGSRSGLSGPFVLFCVARGVRRVMARVVDFLSGRSVARAICWVIGQIVCLVVWSWDGYSVRVWNSFQSMPVPWCMGMPNAGVSMG